MKYVLEAMEDITNPYSGGYYTGKSYIHQGSRYAVTDNDIKKAKIYSSKGRAERASEMLFENYIFEAVKLRKGD